MNSTSGVTLMSALSPLVCRNVHGHGKYLRSLGELVNCALWLRPDGLAPQFAFTNSPPTNSVTRFLDEIVEQLRRRVIHFDVKYSIGRR